MIDISITKSLSYKSGSNPIFQIKWDEVGQIEFSDQLLLLLLNQFSHVRLCVTSQTAAHQAPPSLGFSRQEHWSGLPFPSPMHKSESEVAQSCPTLSDPMDCGPPGSSIHGIFQARVLEWGAIAFSVLFIHTYVCVCVCVCVYVCVCVCMCIHSFLYSFTMQAITEYLVEFPVLYSRSLLVIYFIHSSVWHPTPVLLPGKSHGWKSLVGCSPWGH